MSDNTKSLCAKIPIELHAKISTEKEKKGAVLGDYLTEIIEEYYEIKAKGGKDMSDKNFKTLAIQIEPELMDRIKSHLKTIGMSQKAFLIQIIEKALNDAIDKCESE